MLRKKSRTTRLFRACITGVAVGVTVDFAVGVAVGAGVGAGVGMGVGIAVGEAVYARESRRMYREKIGWRN